MTTAVITYAVRNIDTWLGGGNNREAVFPHFCSSYRIFKHVDKNHVSIVCEDVDLDKMKTTLSSPETEAAKAKDGVIDPIEIYFEVDDVK